MVAYGVNRSSALTIKGIVETVDAKNKYSVRFTVPSGGTFVVKDLTAHSLKICAEDFVPKSKKVAVNAAAELVPQITAAEGHKIPAKRIKTDTQVVTLGFNVVPGEISVARATSRTSSSKWTMSGRPHQWSSQLMIAWSPSICRLKY